MDYADVHEMVTATIFSADGTRAIVGTMKGKCRFYQCSPDLKLEYQAQIGQRPQIWAVFACANLMGEGRWGIESRRSSLFPASQPVTQQSEMKSG